MITQGETSSPAQTPLTTEIETCSKENEKPTSADAQCKLIVPNTTTHSPQASPLWNPDSKNPAKGPEMHCTPQLSRRRCCCQDPPSFHCE